MQWQIGSFASVRCSTASINCVAPFKRANWITQTQPKLIEKTQTKTQTNRLLADNEKKIANCQLQIAFVCWASQMLKGRRDSRLTWKQQLLQRQFELLNNNCNRSRLWRYREAKSTTLLRQQIDNLLEWSFKSNQQQEIDLIDLYLLLFSLLLLLSLL